MKSHSIPMEIGWVSHEICRFSLGNHEKKIPRAIFTSGQQLALVVATSYRAAKRGAAAVTVKISGANEGALAIGNRLGKSG